MWTLILKWVQPKEQVNPLLFHASLKTLILTIITVLSAAICKFKKIALQEKKQMGKTEGKGEES